MEVLCVTVLHINFVSRDDSLSQRNAFPFEVDSVKHQLRYSSHPHIRYYCHKSSLKLTHLENIHLSLYHQILNVMALIMNLVKVII